MLKQMQALTGRSNQELWTNTAWLTLDALLALVPYLLLYFILEQMIGGQPNYYAMSGYCLAMLLVLILRVVSSQHSLKKNNGFSTQASLDIRTNLSEKLKRIPMGDLLALELGKINNILLKDVQLSEQIFNHLFSQIVGTVCLVVLVTTGLMFIDWRLALAMISGLPLAIAAFWLMKSVGEKVKLSLYALSDSVTSGLFDYVQGIRVLRLFNANGAGYLSLAQQIRSLRDASIRFELVAGLAPMSFIVLVEAGFAVLLMVSVHLLLGGQLAVPTLLLFLVLSTRFYRPLTQLAMFLVQIQYFSSAMDRIAKVLEMEELPQSQDQPLAEEAEAAVELNHVSFAYQQQLVLQDVSFRCLPNTITALVGPSGSGKTTITSLIARFWDSHQGQVLLQGLDVKKLAPEDLANQLSVVFQDVYLFDDTVYNNLTMGADISYERVKQVCQATQCWECISRLPEGLQSKVGEGGARLSGGEKQRLSVARAILKDSPVVLLDEATASLDPENECEMQLAIDELVRSKTVIMIAHKLSTVIHADQIVVLNKGRVERIGRHQDLMTCSVTYQRLWQDMSESKGWAL